MYLMLTDQPRYNGVIGTATQQCWYRRLSYATGMIVLLRNSMLGISVSATDELVPSQSVHRQC